MNGFALDVASPEYKALRTELLEAEKSLRDQREAVAALRRRLPTDTLVKEDYVFIEFVDGKEKSVTLSALLSDGGDKPLIMMHYMWAPSNDAPCPMCSMWADGYHAVLPHLQNRATFVMAAKQKAQTVTDFARARGWSGLRVISTGDTSFNSDFGVEDGDDNQFPGVSIFLRGQDGTPRHFYTGGAMMGDGTYRGMDILSPVWNYFDLLPEGRGDFIPSVNYN